MNCIIVTETETQQRKTEAMRFTLIIALMLQAITSFAQDAELLHHSELKKCLPATIGSSYEGEGEMEGSTLKMEGMQMSEATYTYKKKGGGTFDVSIIDYAGTTEIYKSAFAVYQKGLYVENGDEILQATEYKGNPGWTTWNSATKSGDMVISKGERYIIIVSGSDISTLEFVYDVFGGLDLSNLK